MSLYENIKCPVCKNDFVDGDDIVVCPICGTPHHRECYNMIGHCVNQGLHESGYTFESEQKEKIKKIEEENAPQKQIIGAYYQPSEAKDNAQPSDDNKETPKLEEDNKYKDDKSTIDGVSVSDMANVVRVNPAYYIPAFSKLSQKKSKINWNGSGFIFGSLYLLYRKMFKEGLAFFAIIISIFYGSNALIFKFAPEFTKKIIELSASSLDGLYPTQAQIQEVLNASDTKTAMLVTYGALGLIVILHLIIGLFANSFYKRTVTTIIKKTDEQLSGDGMQSKIIITDSSMPQDQLRKMLFARRGGVSFFAPSLVVLFILFIL